MASLTQLVSTAAPVEVGIVVAIVSTLLLLFWTVSR